jgi:hypothetical protein
LIGVPIVLEGELIGAISVGRNVPELSRFVSPQVAGLISSNEGERLLAGHRAYITCLLSPPRSPPEGEHITSA